MTIPEELGLCFGFWDRSSRISSALVADRCKSLSRFYLKSCFPDVPTIESSDIDSIIRIAANTNAKWLLVQAYGHLTLRYNFFTELQQTLLRCKSDDFLVMGHILDRKEGYFELHHQAFLVNLHLFRKLSSPAFGGEVFGTRQMPQPIRSPDNFHDDYTPPWLKPNENRIGTYSKLADGHGFIAASLKAGIGVHGFPISLREKKHFLYPEATTAELAKAFENADAEPAPHMNESQLRFLSGMRQNWFSCRQSIFTFNTDDIRNVPRLTEPHEKLSALYSVASGFRPLMILAKNGFDERKTDVVYFDYSEPALEFRKNMNNNFDGQNFVDFLTQESDRFGWGHYQIREKGGLEIQGNGKFAETFLPHPQIEAIESLWKVTQEAFGGAESFRKLWNQVKKLNHKYVHADLFQSPTAFTEMLQNDKRDSIMIWWSNSFATESMRTFIPEAKIETAYDNFQFLVRGRSASTLVDGFSASNKLVVGKINPSY